MKQKDTSDVIIEWSSALQAGIPHMPDAVADRISHATGDLMNAFAETVMQLSYHAPVSDEVRTKLEAIAAAARQTGDEIASLRTTAQTTLERIGVVERHDNTMQHQLDDHERRLTALEEHHLAAREAGGE